MNKNEVFIEKGYQMENTELAKQIEEFGGAVILNFEEIPLDFPYTSDEIFSQVSKGNVLRFEGSNFCWKKSPFELKGYAGNLGKVTSTVYRIEDNPITEILNGKTVDIDVYEVRPVKISKFSKPVGKVESHLKVVHQRNAEGKNIGQYVVNFTFNNGDASEVSVTYQNGVKTAYSLSKGGFDEPQISCTCFGKTTSKKNVGGIQLRKPIPELLTVEDLQND